VEPSVNDLIFTSYQGQLPSKIEDTSAFPNMSMQIRRATRGLALPGYCPAGVI